MLADSQNRDWPRRVIWGSGAFCLVLGFLVAVGWYLQSEPLIRFLPNSAPMYFNVAIGFVVYGVGLLGVATNQPQVVTVSAILVMSLGLVTLIQYLLGIDVGIDQLLWHDTSRTNLSSGRMSPITALLFALSGFALLLHEQKFLSRLLGISRSQDSRSRLETEEIFPQVTVAFEIIIVIVTTWGFVTFLCYVAGIMGPQILGSLPNTSAHGAAGFTVVGLGLFALAWPEDRLVIFKDSLAAFITGVFTIALLVQLSLSSLAAQKIADVQASLEQENRSQATVYLLAQLLSQLKDAETGQRGYLLTGKDEYLEPYTKAVAKIHVTLQNLENLGINSRVLSPESRNLVRDLTEQKLAELHATLGQREGFESAAYVVQLDHGKKIMDRIRDLIGNAIETEDQVSAQASQEVRASMQRTRAGLAYGSGFSLLFIPVAAALISWQLWKRRVTESELRVLNAGLDKQVEDRTVELAEANVELQREITDRVRAEEALAHSVHELARSNRELEHFAHVASHDLQEPLRKILAFGDRLKVKSGADLDAQGRDYLERMQSAAARMQTLIDDLLTFSRVTTQPHPFIPVDLTVVAQTIVSDMEISIQRVSGHVHIGALPTIDADAVQMGQVLQNLIGNALKFHRQDVAPVVTVSAELVTTSDAGATDGTQPRLCRLTVRDNGIGFDEKYAEQIFQPFQRLFARGEYEGTGMGLAICKRIIERHGGHIMARSVPGEGTTFILTLPVHQPQKEVCQ